MSRRSFPDFARESLTPVNPLMETLMALRRLLRTAPLRSCRRCGCGAHGEACGYLVAVAGDLLAVWTLQIIAVLVTELGMNTDGSQSACVDC